MTTDEASVVVLVGVAALCVVAAAWLWLLPVPEAAVPVDDGVTLAP